MIARHVIVSALRYLWMKSDERQEAIKRARVKPGIYQCCSCNELFKLNECHVDHIVPVGVFVDWNQFMIFFRQGNQPL